MLKLARTQVTVLAFCPAHPQFVASLAHFLCQNTSNQCPVNVFYDDAQSTAMKQSAVIYIGFCSGQQRVKNNPAVAVAII